MNDIVIKLTLIRHGEVPANKEKRYIGLTDENLSNEGVLELERLYNTHKFSKVDFLFCSPMLRCRRTCDILFPNMPYTVIDEFTEMNFGDFEMKNYYDLKNDVYYQEWIDSNGILPFPNGESRSEFIKRCMSGLDKVLEYIINTVSNDEHFYSNNREVDVVCVVHGGTIMAIMSMLENGDYYDYQVKNGESVNIVLCLNLR